MSYTPQGAILQFKKNSAQTMKMVRALSEYYDRKAEAALAVVLSAMANDAKDGNREYAWTDRTSSLRRSISWRVLRPGERGQFTHRFQEKKGGPWKTTVTEMTNDTGGLVGFVWAGMEYAIFVEWKPGYSVLGYTFQKFKPEIVTLLGNKTRIQTVSELKKVIIK